MNAIAVIEHQEKVDRRLSDMDVRMGAKLELLSTYSRDREFQLLSQAVRASTAQKKVFWLRQAASEIGAFISQHAPCVKGCTHCCSIAVLVTKSEAMVIAKAVGMKLNPDAGVDLQENREYSKANTEKFYNVPCNFLVDGACSIYEDRPLACRLHFSMDVDDLLCQLVGELSESPDVPYLNVSDHHFAAIEAFGAGNLVDDIRNWFV